MADFFFVNSNEPPPPTPPPSTTTTTNGFIAKFGPWSLLLVSKSYTQSLGPLGKGISPSQGRYLDRTTQTK
jgi:hypothetical protein